MRMPLVHITSFTCMGTPVRGVGCKCDAASRSSARRGAVEGRLCRNGDEGFYPVLHCLDTLEAGASQLGGAYLPSFQEVAGLVDGQRVQVGQSMLPYGSFGGRLTPPPTMRVAVATLGSALALFFQGHSKPRLFQDYVHPETRRPLAGVRWQGRLLWKGSFGVRRRVPPSPARRSGLWVAHPPCPALGGRGTAPGCGIAAPASSLGPRRSCRCGIEWLCAALLHR